jgi:hypothetical protein
MVLLRRKSKRNRFMQRININLPIARYSRPSLNHPNKKAHENGKYTVPRVAPFIGSIEKKSLV